MNFNEFPSIEGFHHVVKNAEYYNVKFCNYRGKIKLHGTNSAIRVVNGELGIQSRTRFIDIKNDNCGFARWAEKSKPYWQQLSLKDHTIFGEWCGPGIEKGMALNQIPSKIFAVFAIMLGEGENAPVISEPQEIEKLLGNRPSDVHVLPWCSDIFTIDFSNRDRLLEVVENLNKVVTDVEAVDPWVKSVFNVEGIGEGVVYYPVLDNLDRDKLEHFAFKAKGEKHKVVKTKEAVQIDPEVASSIQEFVSMFVTEARLEQGVSVNGLDIKNTGKFLAWFVEDVKKESVLELEASKLTWEQVQKDVQNAARSWYKEKSTAI